jgi:hypothetical protein
MTMRVVIEMSGTSPLLMHNVALSNPNNQFARAISELTSKSDKTREDHLEIARLEFMGSLYIGSKGPMIPSPNVQKCLVQTAKVRREGRSVERALMPLALEIPLLYDGPRLPDEMWSDDRFQYLAPVSVGRAKVQRMRPRFIDWKLISEWELLVDVLDYAKFVRVVSEAGRIEGLGDARTKGFGRFDGRVSKAEALPLKVVNS